MGKILDATIDERTAGRSEAGPDSPAAVTGPTDKRVRLIEELFKDVPVPCAFRFSSGETLSLGQGKPEFTITFHSDRVLDRGLDEYALGRAYVNGEIEIEGDLSRLLEVRDHIRGDITSFFMFKMWLRMLFRNTIGLNRKSIAHHYSFGDDFYLSFVDRKYHLYSHCLFGTDDETLEQAAENKFSTMSEALGLKPGMRLLDIGAGWGAVTRYAGPRGIHVTALTIAEDSEILHRDLIETDRLTNCRVQLDDFLVHEPEEPYDAVVIFGVIEHIPHYRRFARQVWKCLKPGGRIYLDASAVLEKFNVSNFVRTYIYPGTHTYLHLPDLLQEFLMHGFKVLEVVDETDSYHLTLTRWAENFEENREAITKRWGEKVFRAFRMYLWGGACNMRTRGLQAYHVVAERTDDPGIRPGLVKRVRYFTRSLT